MLRGCKRLIKDLLKPVERVCTFQRDKSVSNIITLPWYTASVILCDTIYYEDVSRALNVMDSSNQTQPQNTEHNTEPRVRCSESKVSVFVTQNNKEAQMPWVMRCGIVAVLGYNMKRFETKQSPSRKMGLLDWLFVLIHTVKQT